MMSKLKAHKEDDHDEQANEQTEERARRVLTPLVDGDAGESSGAVMDRRVVLRSRGFISRPEEEMKSVVEHEPHFDADANFIHRCRACGKEARFGYGVSLRNNKLGTWLCAEHRPVSQQKEEQSPGLVVTDGLTSRAMPVELLRDGRGVYGTGDLDLFDLEGVAWSCGIELEPYTFERPPRALILRPDRFPGTKPLGVTGTAVLQKIAGGFRRGPFMRSHEDRLRQFIHHEALNRAGLRWPPTLNPDDPLGGRTDKKQQARNRGIYHGLRLLSLQVINNLIGKALEEAADADAIKAARRFTFKHRENIYRASAHSRRALQLTDTFPVLALTIY